VRLQFVLFVKGTYVQINVIMIIMCTFCNWFLCSCNLQFDQGGLVLQKEQYANKTAEDPKVSCGKHVHQHSREVSVNCTYWCELFQLAAVCNYVRRLRDAKFVHSFSTRPTVWKQQ
jgi:hypothetical protein